MTTLKNSRLLCLSKLTIRFFIRVDNISAFFHFLFRLSLSFFRQITSHFRTERQKVLRYFITESKDGLLKDRHDLFLSNMSTANSPVTISAVHRFVDFRLRIERSSIED